MYITCFLETVQPLTGLHRTYIEITSLWDCPKWCLLFLVNNGAWDTNAMSQSAVNFMQGHCSVVSGVVESKDDLIVIDEHSVYKSFN